MFIYFKISGIKKRIKNKNGWWEEKYDTEINNGENVNDKEREKNEGKKEVKEKQKNEHR